MSVSVSVVALEAILRFRDLPERTEPTHPLLSDRPIDGVQCSMDDRFGHVIFKEAAAG